MTLKQIKVSNKNEKGFILDKLRENGIYNIVKEKWIEIEEILNNSLKVNIKNYWNAFRYIYNYFKLINNIYEIDDDKSRILYILINHYNFNEEDANNYLKSIELWGYSWNEKIVDAYLDMYTNNLKRQILLVLDLLKLDHIEEVKSDEIIWHLRDKQNEFLKSIYNFILYSKENTAYIHSATWSGKTVIFSALINLVLHLSPNAKILITTPTTIAMNRAFDELSKNSGINIWKYYWEEKCIWEHVTIWVINSINNAVSNMDIKEDDFDLIICDEIHDKYLWEINRTLIEFFECKKIWFTATPELINKSVGVLFWRKIWEYLVEEAILDWYLPKINDEHRLFIDDNEFSKLVINWDDYTNKSLEKFNITSIFPDILKLIRMYFYDKHMIIFCPSIKSSKSLSAYLKNNWIKSNHIDWKNKDYEVEDILDWFENWEIQFITCCDKLKASYDSDIIDWAMILRPVRSPASLMQMIWRPLHWKYIDENGKKSPKKEIIVVDLVSDTKQINWWNITARVLNMILDYEKWTKIRENIIISDISFLSEILLYYNIIDDCSDKWIIKVFEYFRKLFWLELSEFYTKFYLNEKIYDDKKETYELEIISNNNFSQEYSWRKRKISITFEMYRKIVSNLRKNKKWDNYNKPSTLEVFKKKYLSTSVNLWLYNFNFLVDKEYNEAFIIENFLIKKVIWNPNIFWEENYILETDKWNIIVNKNLEILKNELGEVISNQFKYKWWSSLHEFVFNKYSYFNVYSEKTWKHIISENWNILKTLDWEIIRKYNWIKVNSWLSKERYLLISTDTIKYGIMNEKWDVLKTKNWDLITNIYNWLVNFRWKKYMNAEIEKWDDRVKRILDSNYQELTLNWKLVQSIQNKNIQIWWENYQRIQFEGEKECYISNYDKILDLNWEIVTKIDNKWNALNIDNSYTQTIRFLWKNYFITETQNWEVSYIDKEKNILYNENNEKITFISWQHSVYSFYNKNYQEVETRELWNHYLNQEKEVFKLDWNIIVKIVKCYFYKHHTWEEVFSFITKNGLKFTLDKNLNPIYDIQGNKIDYIYDWDYDKNGKKRINKNAEDWNIIKNKYFSYIELLWVKYEESFVENIWKCYLDNENKYLRDENWKIISDIKSYCSIKLWNTQYYPVTFLNKEIAYIKEGWECLKNENWKIIRNIDLNSFIEKDDKKYYYVEFSGWEKWYLNDNLENI